MVEKYLTINLEDDQSEKIAEVIKNKSCKKILSLLVEKDMSSSEIAKALGSPLNTIGYNLDKLVDSGIVEKSNYFFWSSKGKKIPIYRVTNKKIVIFTKNSFKGVIPAILISGLAVLIIKFNMVYYSITYDQTAQNSAILAASPSIEAAYSAAQGVPNAVGASGAWIWFAFGAVFALSIFTVWNWRKIWAKNI